MTPWLIPVFLLLAGAALALGVIGTRWRRASEARRRLHEVFPGGPAIPVEASGLELWLARAGVTRDSAAMTFVIVQTSAMALALLGLGLLHMTQGVEYLLAGLRPLPGAVGDLLAPVVVGLPWGMAILIVAAPVTIVRRWRRLRVEQIEQDLPVTLDLLATLTEGGLGFDAALDRILDSQPGDRPLMREFRLFQIDVLAGRPRIESLRGLARRLDVTSCSIFLSAVVQAEQIGASMAEVMRVQAHDLRGRRRERALEWAMAAPTKQLVPMVTCFLPGILLAAVGPSIYQFFQFAEAFLQSAGR